MTYSQAWHEYSGDMSEIICSSCRQNDRIVFIGQIYAPIFAMNLERSLYVFVCNSRSCSLSSKGWIILRNQTISIPENTSKKVDKKASTVWSFDEDVDEAEDLEDIRKLIDARDANIASSSSSSLSILKKGGITSPVVQRPVSSTLSSILPYFPVEDLEDPRGQEEYEDSSAGDAHVDQLLSRYLETEEDGRIVDLIRSQPPPAPVTQPRARVIIEQREEEGEDRDDASLDDQIGRQDPRSQTESLFQEIVSFEPRQVVRYIYEGSPLWCTLPVPSRAQTIPACELCGSPRVFEFQLMPALLTFLSSNRPHSADPSTGVIIAEETEDFDENEERDDVDRPARPTASQLSRFIQALDDGFDFGVVAVYSCSSSCSSPHLCHEYVVVQGPADIGN